MAGPSTGSAAEVRAASRKRIPVRYPSGRLFKPNRPEEFAMDVDDDDNSKKADDDEISIMYDMDVDAVSSAINKQEENVANKKIKIAKNAAQNLGYVVPQSIPFLFPSSSSSSSSSSSTVAPSSSPAGSASSSSAGAASSSSTPQNMIVDRPDGVKRDNDDDSSKPKKSQRKGGDLSFTKKRKSTTCFD